MLQSTVVKHGSLPRFVEKRKYGLPCLGHPGISDTVTAWCHRLSILLEVVSVLALYYLVFWVVVSNPAPLKSLIVGVVVSARARSFPSLAGSNLLR